jgi:hypothetical protein
MKKVRHTEYRDCEFLVRAEVEDNTLILIKDPKPGYKQKPTYFVYWGSTNSNLEQAGREELRTPSGRKVSQKTAIKKFTQMVEAAKYLTFSKL